MPELVDPDLRLQELQHALDELKQARVAAALAKERVQAAREEAHRHMRRLGLARMAAEMPFSDSVPLMRELYWDYPEVAADQIAKSFGMRGGNEVFRVVGSDTRLAACPGGCGKTVTRIAASRSHSRVPYCPRCEAVVKEQARERELERQRWLREQEAEERELQARLQAAIANGMSPAATYTEYAGFPGTWLVEPADDQGHP